MKPYLKESEGSKEWIGLTVRTSSKFWVSMPTIAGLDILDKTKENKDSWNRGLRKVEAKYDEIRRIKVREKNAKDKKYIGDLQIERG